MKKARHCFSLFLLCLLVSCAASAMDPVKPTAFTLNRTDLSFFAPGERFDLKVRLEPADATAEVTWRSSDPDVASVAWNGLVTAVSKGTVTITAAIAGLGEQTCTIRCSFDTSPTPASTPIPTPAPTPPPPTVAMERPDLTGEWHRTSCHSECAAVLTISEQTAEGFTVEAECYYGSHMGSLYPTAARFIGEASGLMEVYGDYEYRTETGPKPPVKFFWDGDTMTVTTTAWDTDLGFGANVRIDGTYTRGEPEYTNAGQLDRILSEEEQKRLRDVVEDYDWSVAQVLGNGTIEEDILCLLADGRKGRYLSAWYSPNWGYTLEVILTEDGKTYFQGNVGFYTDDAGATEMPQVVWPIKDDTHDAFTVPTGGRLGTVLVTVEMVEGEYEFMNPATLSVWNPEDLSKPIQVIEEEGFTHYYELMDANFDGYSDFCYTWFLSATNANETLWVWNEEKGEFENSGEFLGYGLVLDMEHKTIFNYTHGSAICGIGTIYYWENKELIEARTVEVNFPSGDYDEPMELIVCDRIDGEMSEIYRETYPIDDDSIYIEAIKWYDPSYYGE